jgi:replicative DNA helicase
MTATSVSRNDNRQVQVSELSRSTKLIAREAGIPLIEVAQLNRSSESRDGHRPRMSDLRDSGAIEADADKIILIHREDYYHENEPGYIRNNEADIIVAKQRNGPTGVVKLRWRGPTTSFSEIDAADLPLPF